MSDLPQNWKEVSFMDILDIQGGTQPPKKEFLYEPKDGYIRLLQIRDFGEKPFVTYVKIKSSLKTVVEEDVLIARYGASIGRICTGMNGAYNVALSKVIIPEQIYKRFIFYLLKSSHFQSPILQTQRSAQDGFNKDDLQEITLPIPPLNEQKRIVEKLEKLLGKVESVGARLDKIPAILKRFRQAVLAAACSGKLTADWRNENKNEDAEVLRKQISHYFNRAIEKFDSNSFLGEIPNDWIWVRLGEVITELRNGVPIRPEMQPPGTPILRISAARSGSVDLSDVRYLPNSENYLPNFKLKDGDLLFTRYNGSIDLLGVCGMVRGLGSKNLLYPDKLMRVRFGHQFILPEYAEIFFQSPEARKRMVEKSKSSAGQNGISGSDVKLQLFALPPLEEQKEIVRRVEDLFKFADQIEARYKKARSYTDKLTQSILAKAFRGELVPQSDADEPAAVLLERIRQEKENKSKIGGKTSKRKGKSERTHNQHSLFANG